MSIKVQSHVWEHSPAKGGELLILLAIADFADDTGIAWPSIDTLAQKARLSTRQTQYNVRALIAGGQIAVEENAGPHGTHRYRVLGVQSLQGAKTARVQSATQRGAISDTGGVQPIAPEPSVEPSKNRHSSSPVSPKPKPARKTTIPDDYGISDRMLSWAAEKGMTRDNLEDQIERFVNNAAMKQLSYADWDRAFQNWMLNARDWGQLRTQPSGPMRVVNGGNPRPSPGKRGFTGDELIAMSRANPDDDERSIFGDVIETKGRIAR